MASNGRNGLPERRPPHYPVSSSDSRRTSTRPSVRSFNASFPRPPSYDHHSFATTSARTPRTLPSSSSARASANVPPFGVADRLSNSTFYPSLATQANTNTGEDFAFQRALQESQQEDASTNGQYDDEDIALQQALLESQHQMPTGRAEFASPGSDSEDADLQQALRESQQEGDEIMARQLAEEDFQAARSREAEKQRLASVQAAQPAPPAYTPGLVDSDTIVEQAMRESPAAMFGDRGPDADADTNLTISVVNEADSAAGSDSSSKWQLPRATTVRALKHMCEAVFHVPVQQQNLIGFDVDVPPLDSHRLQNLINPETRELHLLLLRIPEDEVPDLEASNDSMPSHAASGHPNRVLADEQQASSSIFPAIPQVSGDPPRLSSLSRFEAQPVLDTTFDPFRPGGWVQDSWADDESVAAATLPREQANVRDLEAAFLHREEEDMPSEGEFLLPDSESNGNARAFASAFEAQHGPFPSFMRGDFSQAVREARRQQRPLAVYVHDDREVDSAAALDQLTHEHVSMVLSSYFVLWGHDFSRHEARQHLFDTTRDTVAVVEGLTGELPALLILTPHGSIFSFARAFRVGHMSPLTLATELTEVALLYQETVAQAPSQSVESLDRQDLVAEQDEAYMASLREDQAKAAERERLEAEAERDRQRLEAESEAMRRAEVAAEEAAAARAETHAQQLRDEPAGNDKSAFTIKFQLPSGTVTRRFYADATVRELFDFVGSLNLGDVAHCILKDPVGNFVLRHGQGQQRLRKLGLPSRFKVHLQQEDGDAEMEEE